jgi:pyruvate dehydrogenase E2 component (dihydrolipoamide acetyltransferase)
MAKILDMPKLSPTMEEGVLSAWHKKEGDPVEVDDLLAEVETDKATMEFRAFDKGTLLKILVAPGALVKLGDPVAIVGDAGEDVTALVPSGAKQEAAAPAASAENEVVVAPEKPAVTPEVPALSETAPKAQHPERVPPTEAASQRVSSGGMLDRTQREGVSEQSPPAVRGKDLPAIAEGRVMASPYVRKAARDRGIDLHGTQGSGPGGRVVMRDLEAGVAIERVESVAPSHAMSPVTMPAPPMARTGLAAPEVRPLSMMRKTIARRLTESKQTVPHFYLSIDVDAENLVAFREEINRELEESSPKKIDDGTKPLKISVNDLLIKACAVALVRVPECNASFTPEAILIHHRVDISVAVAIPDGLVTPVVRNADAKSIVVVAREVRELAARARAKKLKPEEMQDGTFSISNLGMFGIDGFSAVINPPEGAILAVGAVRDEPVVRSGAVVPGKRLAMTLSCDHRVVDGAIGAAFLAELRSLLEHPIRVLTG